MVIEAYNLSTWETDAGDSLQVQGHLGLHNETLSKNFKNRPGES